MDKICSVPRGVVDGLRYGELYQPKTMIWLRNWVELWMNLEAPSEKFETLTMVWKRKMMDSFRSSLAPKFQRPCELAPYLLFNNTNFFILFYIS